MDTLTDLIILIAILVLVVPIIGYVFSKSAGKSRGSSGNIVLGATDGFLNRDKQSAVHYVVEEKTKKMEEIFTDEPNKKAPD